MRCPVGPFLLLASVCTGAAWAADQHQHRHTGADPKKVGIVSFENSCSPLVQERIGRAMAFLHSFWYEEVDREFRGVTVQDPKCPIAWWGVAMAQWQPLWEVRGPSREALARGRAAIEKGRAIPSGTARERDYVAALEKFYAGFETVDHTERVLAYERAMEALHAKYPSDPEAAVFYALALLGSAASLPPDKTYARQKQAGELLQPIFRRGPDHPGVAHYIIHAYDYPALAAGALDAARRYASIAPDSPHALHMPSHIFTRLGLWKESIASKRTLVEHREDYWARQVEVQRRGAEAWLAFAEGKHEKALELMHSAADLEDTMDKHPVTPGQIVPARDLLGQMLLEFDRPKDALAEFSRVLAAEPNRFGALHGAARSAEVGGQDVRARELYQNLVRLGPESNRREVQHARDVLAGKTH